MVLDAATGEVLAMANARTFDPRAFAAADESTLGNAAVSSPYEPGSVNKVVTMAAALEYGTATPERVFAVPGSIRVADRTVSDAWNHGTEDYTLTGILAKSSNVGTIMAAREVGEDRFADMLARFGLGRRTGVGLPGESPGRVPSRETWSGSTFGNLPIGQGLSVTALQMAGMYQAVANDGVRVPPRIVEATIGPDGVRTPTPAPRPVRVVSPETAQKLRTMLTAVTQDGGTQDSRGTGSAAAIPGYQVAGKTGTAQQVDPTCGCYASVDVLDHLRGHAARAGPALRRRDHAGRPAGRYERGSAVPRDRVVPGAAREAAGEPGPAAGPDPGDARPAGGRGGPGPNAPANAASGPVDGVAPAPAPAPGAHPTRLTRTETQRLAYRNARLAYRSAGLAPSVTRAESLALCARESCVCAREFRVRARRVERCVLGVRHRACDPGSRGSRGRGAAVGHDHGRR